MFEWLKRLVRKPGMAKRDEPDDSDSTRIEKSPPPVRTAVSPIADIRRIFTPSAPQSEQTPRTLAAEQSNPYLDRPVIFEPALIQYSAFRAGEPRFTNEEEAHRWFELRNRVLHHILSIIRDSPAKEHLILRGSVLLATWFGRHARRPGDLDFVVLPESWKHASLLGRGLLQVIEKCLRGSSDLSGIAFEIPNESFVKDDIWTYEKAPGTRMIVPWHCHEASLSGTVQMDFVFGEKMPSEPVLTEIELAGKKKPVTLLCASPAQSLAWKLLWLSSDSYCQGKDLFDAVLLAEHVSLEVEILRKTFAPEFATPAFSSVNVDAGALRQFNEAEIMLWHVEWNNFVREYPDVTGSVEDWKRRLVEALRPLLDELEKGAC